MREGDERPHWGLGEFPDVAEFFPPASLEPARRPPSVHAMPPTAQAAVSKGRLQRTDFGKLLLTNGGFLLGCDGRTYYAAHTENVLAIRRAAPFRISSLPPGLPRPPRTGETLPYTPPR